MIIRLAQHSGFCFGVRRALKLALDGAREYGKVYTLGQLIHNPQVVKGLEEAGIYQVADAASLHETVVVIRSHGIDKATLELLQKNKNKIIDATCPYVKRTHQIIQQANAEGYPVLILGDPSHPEVIGIKSFGDEHTEVYQPGSALPALKHKNLCVISQTTQKLENLQELVVALLPLISELNICNTICTATSLRQNASAALALHSDVMIIIGGKNSSNTRMLASLCSQYTPSYHLESAAELKPEMFLGKERVGIAAGASTPEAHILEVYNTIKKINGDADQVENLESIPLFKEESC